MRSPGPILSFGWRFALSLVLVWPLVLAQAALTRVRR